jgi:ABC-2 type transport system ATP-binding protein
VREFIKELRQEGRTIFLTTHNLPEADELCTLIAIFSTRLLRVDTPSNLRSGLFGTGTVVRVAGDANRWLPAARALPFAREVAARDGALSIKLDDPDSQNPLLVQALVGAGAPIRYIEPMEHSLEDVYLQLVEEPRSRESGIGNQQ